MSPRFCFITILFLVAISSFVNPSQSARKSKEKREPCQRFSLHLHDLLFDGQNIDLANATSSIVANRTNLGGYKFGEFVVFDDPVTADSDLRSAPVARAQGFYFYDKKTTYNAWVAFTLVFNSTEHKGSITIIGADLMYEEMRDIPVVGGTGDFFMTRGIATVVTEAYEGGYYFRLQMDVKLYECN